MSEIEKRTSSEDRSGSGFASVPVWLFFLLGVTALWGMNYLDKRGGGFNPLVFAPHANMASLIDLQPPSEGGEILKKGKAIYDTYCSVCHQPNGLGVAGQFPPLADSDWVLTEGPNRIVSLILNGIQGPITVNGKAFNGAMPPWSELLSDEDIAAVATYIRSNAAWGNSASAVTPEEVAALRSSNAGKGTWQASELLKIPDQ